MQKEKKRVVMLAKGPYYANAFMAQLTRDGIILSFGIDESNPDGKTSRIHSQILLPKNSVGPISKLFQKIDEDLKNASKKAGLFSLDDIPTDL